jgi:hypothetical protein
MNNTNAENNDEMSDQEMEILYGSRATPRVQERNASLIVKNLPRIATVVSMWKTPIDDETLMAALTLWREEYHRRSFETSVNAETWLTASLAAAIQTVIDSKEDTK